MKSPGPVLTHAEQIKLFEELARHQRNAWRAARKRRREDPHGKLIRELARNSPKVREHIALADRCVDAIVRGNLRLVLQIARRYHAKNGSLSLSDLVQDGSLGLLRAIRTFDVKLGFRFSTYAVWWIRQNILRSIANTGREIRLPVHVSELIRRVSLVRHNLENRLGRTPLVEEIAAAAKVSVAKVEELREWAGVPLPLNESGDWADEEIADQETLLDREEMALNAIELMAKLPPIQRMILIQRFGLGESNEYTLKQIGKERGLSKERIRQLETLALENLKKLLTKKPDDPRTKQCNTCNEERSFSRFTLDRTSFDGLRGSCKDCAKSRREARASH